MFDNVFNENMTSSEARMALFKAVEGKTKEEIEQLKSAFKKVFPAIFKRESELADQGWLLN